MAVYTDVTADDLDEFLAGYDIGELLSYKGIAEGVENSNFLLHTGAGYFILTLYEKRVAEDDLPFFLALMEHLAARGITCPQPVKNRARRPARARWPAGRRRSSPFSKACGSAGRAPAHCAAVGEALARLHLAGADFRDAARQRARHRKLAPALRACQGRAATACAPGLCAEIARELDALERPGRATCRRASSMPICFPTTCSSSATRCPA